MSRFNVQREQLSGYIQNAIMCIEFGTNLKFTRAEDWTNQGHALCRKFIQRGANLGWYYKVHQNAVRT